MVKFRSHDHRCGRSQRLLVAALASSGSHREAERLLRAGPERLRQIHGEDHPETREAREALAGLVGQLCVSAASANPI